MNKELKLRVENVWEKLSYFNEHLKKQITGKYRQVKCLLAWARKEGGTQSLVALSPSYSEKIDQ